MVAELSDAKLLACMLECSPDRNKRAAARDDDDTKRQLGGAQGEPATNETGSSLSYNKQQRASTLGDM